MVIKNPSPERQLAKQARENCIKFLTTFESVDGRPMTREEAIAYINRNKEEEMVIKKPGFWARNGRW